jgi:hypothetical protein
MVENGSHHLSTVEDVLKVLGRGRARELAGVKARTGPAMWRLRKVFPPKSYAAMSAALAAEGYTADLSLWRQLPPEA